MTPLVSKNSKIITVGLSTFEYTAVENWLKHNRTKQDAPKLLRNVNMIITFDCGKGVSASSSNLIGGGRVCPSCNLIYQLFFMMKILFQLF